MPSAKKPRKPVESPRLPRSFDTAALAKTVDTYRHPSGLSEWTRESIYAARDQQVRGRFKSPVNLARSFLTDGDIYAACVNRNAPHRGLPREVRCRAALEGTAAAILAEAAATFGCDTSSSLPAGVIADGFDRVAMHAYGVDQIHWEARSDGSRLDAFVQPFPLESCEYDEQARCMMAITTEGRVPVIHGDGRWIVHAKHWDRPWRWGALVALGTLWPALAFARRDQGKNSESHGEDKWIGHMPEGVNTGDEQGQAMLTELAKLYDFRRVMVAPHGSTIERNEAKGQNWQIFKEILDSGRKLAQLIMLGQDGSMTNSGGDYIKSWGLFGVRNDIIESDIATVGGAYSTGLLRPWSLINFGRWDRLELAWQMPDADADARRQSIATRRKAFWEDVGLARANGALVDREYITSLAASLGVDAPRLADSAPSGADFFGYELDAGAFTLDEVRARKGLGPLPDGRGAMTVPEARALEAQAPALPANPTPARTPLRALPPA